MWKAAEKGLLNVYAPQDDGKKRKLRLDICSYLSTSSKLFCLMGDFNSVRNEEERRGCTVHKRRAADFNAFIKATDLQELHKGGRRFTWVGQGGLKLSKLDRFLLSRELLDLWTDLAVVALERCFTDHCPIILKTSNANFGPIPFRFFNQWIDKEGFKDMVAESWNTELCTGSASFSLKEKLKALKKTIKVWKESSWEVGDKELKEAKK